MHSVEQEAKTKEEAVELAIKKLGLQREEVDIEVINEGTNGFLGLIGSKPVKIRVKAKDTYLADLKIFLSETFKFIAPDISFDIFPEQDKYNIAIHTENPANLIGKHGSMIDSLEILANIVVNKSRVDKKKVSININDYKEKREEFISNLARRAARQVLQTKRRIALEPMPTQERKLVHTLLGNMNNIKTYSEDKGRKRHIVIELKEKEKRQGTRRNSRML